MFAPFSYARPEKIDDALKLLQAEDAYPHSGGTDLLTCLREQLFPVQRIVSLAALPKMTGVEESGKGVRIGALTTIVDIAENTLLQKHYAALAQAAGEVASPQIRNQGTIGGNLCQKTRCWYYRGEFHCIRKGGPTCYALKGENQFHCILGGANCFMVHPSDPLPALAALEAKVVALGPEGERRIKAEAFAMPPADDPTRATVLDDGEVVIGVELPAWPQQAYSAYRKVRTRRSWDFALAGMACVIEPKGGSVGRARIVFSGVAPIPWRSKAAEKAITGTKLDKDSIEKAAQAATAEAKPLKQNAFKVQLLQGVVREELAKAAEAIG